MITSEEIRRKTQPVDFVNASSLLSDEEKEIRDRVREHVDREIVPVMADYWDRAEFPFELVPGLGSSGSWVAPSRRSTAAPAGVM